MTLQVTASKQTAFMNHEVPLLNVWPTPSQATRKPLASIVSILTLPKFHLATCNMDTDSGFTSLLITVRKFYNLICYLQQ